MSDLYFWENVFSSGFQDKLGHCNSHILVGCPAAEELIHVFLTRTLKEEENIDKYDGLLHFQCVFSDIEKISPHT